MESCQRVAIPADATRKYATFYVDHRMQGLRDSLGWSLKKLAELPFMVFVHRLEIDFLRPARGDQEITITSSVREFRGPDALIECAMADEKATTLSRALMTVAYVEKKTNRSADWPSEVMALFYEKGP